MTEKYMKGVVYHFSADKNVILDKNNNVAVWCDARRSRVYVGWQRFKQSIKNLRP